MFDTLDWITAENNRPGSAFTDKVAVDKVATMGHSCDRGATTADRRTMLRNTDMAYGSVAKWLHWLMAVWVLMACAIIFYLTWGYTGEGAPPGLNYHKAVGFSLLIPFVVRVYWRATTPAPRLLDSMPAWQEQASCLSHFLLYFYMLAMPISGYLGNGAGVNYGFFRIPSFRGSGIADRIFSTFGTTYDQWNVFFDTFHYGISGPFILPILLLVHAGAAIYHHAVQKDKVLMRMLPDKS